MIDWKTAINRVPAEQLDQVLSPVFDAVALKKATLLCKGLPAGPGAASGVFSSMPKKPWKRPRRARFCLPGGNLPEDLRGDDCRTGHLDSRGGVSSHAALVARQMGKVCVCGAADLEVNYKSDRQGCRKTFKEGDYLSINGTSGEVFAGELKTAPSEIIQVLVEKKLDPKKSGITKTFPSSWIGAKRPPR